MMAVCKLMVVLGMVAFAQAFAPFGSTTVTSSVFQGDSLTATKHVDSLSTRANVGPLMMASSAALRDRMGSVRNTKKITSAMKLVAAAKVRRAQDAVLRTRPFSEILQGIFGALVQQLGREDINLPLLQQREVKHVTLLAVAGDRGLCGAYNSYAIKKTESRIKELMEQGVEVELICVGKKMTQYWRRRADRVVTKAKFECGQNPNAAIAGQISQLLLDTYLSGETDSCELIYTRFVSLVASEPAIRTLVPLSLRGIESEGDEIFQLTTQDGVLRVNREQLPPTPPAELAPQLVFDVSPLELINAMLPLYLDGQILRMLQESVASELAARMTAMSSASDNAGDLLKDLSKQYNRARQASVTQELLEIVAGATALEG